MADLQFKIFTLFFSKFNLQLVGFLQPNKVSSLTFRDWQWYIKTLRSTWNGKNIESPPKKNIEKKTKNPPKTVTNYPKLSETFFGFATLPHVILHDWLLLQGLVDFDPLKSIVPNQRPSSGEDEECWQTLPQPQHGWGKWSLVRAWFQARLHEVHRCCWSGSHTRTSLADFLWDFFEKTKKKGALK